MDGAYGIRASVKRWASTRGVVYMRVDGVRAHNR